MRKPTWTIKFFRLPRPQIGAYYNGLRWKDKFHTPRCEMSPTLQIYFLWWVLYIVQEDDDRYWEQWLWLHKYSFSDYDKAVETWGWVDVHTGESTWKEYPKKSLIHF